MPKCSSTSASTLVSTLQLFVAQTWTWAFCNARTAGSGAMWPFHAEFRVLNVSNVMTLTSPRTTANSGGAARLMRRQIHLISKWRRVNLALTPSSALIVEGTIKLTPINVPSRDTTSTESSSRRNISRSMKTESNLFTLQKVARINYDPMKPQYYFSKRLQE